MKNKSGIIFLIIAVALMGGGGYYLYPRHESVSEPEPVACTQEALLCPDGSSVGRQGPACIFKSCPNPSSPLTGQLKQSGGNVTLIMASPDPNGQEVSYALPLTNVDSNAVAQLVGKKVDVLGTFLEGNILRVDRVVLSGEGDVTLGEVSVGKTVYVNGVRITLNRIVSDSRCPADVQCIWAGSVKANASLKSDTDRETRDIETGKPPVGFDSFLISIEGVKPARVAGKELDPQSYILTFKVAPTR